MELILSRALHGFNGINVNGHESIKNRDAGGVVRKRNGVRDVTIRRVKPCDLNDAENKYEDNEYVATMFRI